MNDDRLERLLRGYELPDAPRSLDARVIPEAGRILDRARMQSATADLAHDIASALGFGYLNYVIDLVTGHDADYRVDLL